MIALGCLREPSCNGNVTEFREFTLSWITTIRNKVMKEDTQVHAVLWPLYTSSPDAVSKTTSQAEIFLSQLVRDSRFLQIKLIVEPEWNKILALYAPTTP
ncbi:hypothetical protein T12_7435 [Trichinella patagoniensis]|uniref:Uncharacterized protein n=1 Tax=Trichinella patagoniensis TaxID=990121 RepID=A0A0V0Z8J1_9BILA|nr:hypothetical protein T12_7435 [Trichinella patagoniensis]